MDDRRVTPLAGFADVVLFVVAIFVIESQDTPDSTRPAPRSRPTSTGRSARSPSRSCSGGSARSRSSGSSTACGPHRALLRAARAAYVLLRLRRRAVHARVVRARPRRPRWPATSWTAARAGRRAGDQSLGDGFFFGAEVMLAGFFLAVGLAAVTARALPGVARLARPPARRDRADPADRLGRRDLGFPALDPARLGALWCGAPRSRSGPEPGRAGPSTGTEPCGAHASAGRP